MITCDSQCISMFKMAGNARKYLVNIFMGVPHRQETKFYLQSQKNYTVMILMDLHTFLKMPNCTSIAAKVRENLFLLSLQVLSIWI